MDGLYGISSLLRPGIPKEGPEAVKEVAKEMESLFAYELIKAMRRTTSQEGLGGDTYMSLFDMEVARLLAERGLGLQDMLVRGINSLEGNGTDETDTDSPSR